MEFRDCQPPALPGVRTPVTFMSPSHQRHNPRQSRGQTLFVTKDGHPLVKQSIKFYETNRSRPGTIADG